MEYGRLLSRAWDTIWGHKYLILLGVLAALGSGGGGGGGAASGTGFRFDGLELPRPEEFRIPEFGMPGLAPTAVGVFAIIILAVVILAAVALWVVSTISRGGLIAAVDTVEGGGYSSFGQAWTAGWRKGWRLVGIALLPAIPILLLVGLAAAAALALYLPTPVPARANVGILAPIAIFLGCILMPVALLLGALEAFANRACMLEDLGVFGSYRRGFKVLIANLGPAVVLFLIQIAIGIGVAIVGLLPAILMTVCCVLWPLLLLAQGAISGYFSTMWTLAWRQWTGLTSTAEAPALTVE